MNDIFLSIERNLIHAITDSKSIFDNVSSHRVTEKDLVVDMNFIREQIDRRLINVEWVEESGQLSDALTKRGASSAALRNTLINGTISKFNL